MPENIKRISTADLRKKADELSKQKREELIRKQELERQKREEAAQQNKIPNYKGGSLWQQYKAALESGEAKNADDFISKRNARNEAWNKVGYETLESDISKSNRLLSDTFGETYDFSKYYSPDSINKAANSVKGIRDRLNSLSEYLGAYGGNDTDKKNISDAIKAYDDQYNSLLKAAEYYGRFKGESDYNYRTDKRRDEDYIVNEYDTEAGKKNLEKIESSLSELEEAYRTLDKENYALSLEKAFQRGETTVEIPKNKMTEFLRQYMSDDQKDKSNYVKIDLVKFMNDYNSKKNGLTQEYQLESFALNNADRMRTAAAYKKLAENQDFLQGVISGKAVENPTFEDYLNYENEMLRLAEKVNSGIATREEQRKYAELSENAPTVKNRFRFLEDAQSGKYGGQGYEQNSTYSGLDKALLNYKQYHYEQMTDDEKRVYYYVLGTQGAEAADRYLDDLKTTLDYRNTEEVKQYIRDLKNSKIFGNVSAAALANTFGGLGGAALGYLLADKNEGINKAAGDVVYSAASVPLNVLGGGISTIGEIGQRLSLASKGDWGGKGYNPYENYNLFSVAGREARGLVAKDIEDSIGWEMFGQNVMSQVYQSLMSGADSAFGMATLGKLYTISMGGSAAASKAAELYESGASSSQIYWESLLSGIAEATFEYLSIENLSSIKSIVESKPTTLKKAIKMILTQNGIEASEEVFTEIANMVIDKGIKKYDSDYDRKVTEYVRDGMTREEAVKKAAGEVAADIGWAGAGGFISGFASSTLTISGAYRAGKENADAQIFAIDPGNAEGLYNNAKNIDYSILNDASEALKKGDAKAAAEIISEGKDWYEYLKSYAKEKYGKNQASEISANIDASIDNLNQIKNLISSGDINADSIQAVLEKAKSAQDTKVDVTSANDEKLFSLLAKGELSNKDIERNILKDRGTLAAFERLTGLRIGGTTVSQKRAYVREAFKAVSSSTETLKAAQNAIESGATATEGHKNAAVIIDQAIQANRAENSRLRNSEKVKSAETKAAIDATNRQHRFLETVRNYVINGGDLSGFTESPVANVSGEGGTNSSETKTTQETAKKRVRADFSAYQDEKYSAENASALANLNSKAEQDAFFRNENAGIEQEIKNIESSDSITAEEKAQRIGELKEAASRNNSLAKAMDDFREMGRLVRAGEVDKVIDSLRKPLKKMGVNIEVVDNVEAADGMKSGAYFDKSTNTIKVSRDWNGVENVVKLELAADGNGFVLNSGKSVSFDRAVTQTIAHEIAHADSGLTLDFIKAVAGTQYDAFDLKGRLEHPDDRSWRSEDARKEENWRRYVDAYTEQAMLEMKGTEEQRRASAEKVVNDAYIFEEIMADMFGAAVDDMGHSSKAGENIFWAMNRNKPGIIKRILNALERFIARIRGKDAYLAVEQRQAAERLRDMLTGELKRAYGADVKGKAAVESDGNRYSLAGANSRTADLNSLGGAYQMYQNGVSMDTIRKRTGWWLGKDGKWRYEIDDSKMQFNPEGYVDNPQTVGDYVKHDQLFAAYPWIADIPVHMVDVVTGGSPATNGKYSPDRKFIELKKGLTSEKAKYVLSHELQHAIQQAEGFVRGTSPKTGMFYAVNLAYDLVKNNPEFVAESKPQDKMNYLIGYLEAKGGASLGDYAKYYYFQNYGETEARNVSQRLDMTEEERRALPIENNGEVFSYDEVFEKIVDNLKAIGYNKKQIDTILKEGVSYDIEQTDVQTSADEVVKRRRNDREETGRLSDADENGRRPGEIYRTGKIPTAGVSESAEILDSERRNGGLRRGNRGTDSQNGALGAGSEAGKRLNEVSKPEKKFSLSSTVEQTKDLIAVHNMTAAELEKSLDLGGLPMPSIAIIKAADGHSEYGDVSLVFGKDTIDPKKSARNKVYGGDAWTPTFPKIDYKANEKVGKRIRDKYYDLSRKYGYDNTRALYNYAQDLSDVLTSEGGEKAMIDKLYGDTGMMQIYLMDTGKGRVANVNKETKTALTDGQVRQYENLIDTLGRDEMNGFAKKDGEELSDLVRRRKAFIEENEAGIRKAFEKTFIEDGMSAKDAAEVSAELALSDLRKYVLDTFNYIKNGAETVKTEFDSEATDAAIKKAADGEGYRKWINNLFGGAEEKSGIRNSKDAYTASGNRRSFEALHWENNLENIVNAMLEQDETGGAFFSGTGIWGVSAKKYNSISEIKNDSSRLRTMNEAEYNALKEQYGARMQEIAQTLIDPKNDNYFIASDDAYSLIVDAVRNSKDESGILRYLKKYNSRATEKTASDIAALVRDIAEMPTGYFEAKPQRAVGFDEVKAVILPDNASGELVSRLESDGINTVTYKAGDENSRLEALNGVRDVRFSLTRANDEYMKAVESGNVEEQQRLVDEAAKANGYDRLFWHGSKKGGGFTEFRDWSYFTENKKYASRYAKAGDRGSLYEVYANLGNTFDTRKPECREIFDKMRSEYGLSKVQESGLPDWTDGYDIAEFIDENGLDYDSIILDEGGDLVDGKPVSRGFSYVIRSSEQVKSADSITYDDSGNVIPLTERFDSGNRDIRWSLTGTNEDMAEAAEFSDSGIRYSLRKEDPPKKTLTGYKVFVVKNGKLYPPMVANPDAADTPVGVWLNADIGAQAPDSKTGRKQVKAGGKGTQGGSGSLAFRPGWHLGETPLATQFDRTNPETGKRELFPENFVWAECEIAADKNYQEEAMSYGYTKSGKFQHSLAGLPKLPVDGYYKYRTNPNPDTVPWLITGAMKVNRLLDDAEVNRILESKGLPPKNRVGGNKTLADLGLEETAKRLNGDGNIRYSLSANAAEEIKKALADKNYSSEIKLTDTTPTIMLGHNGVKNLPLMMRATHLRENILTREQAKAKGLSVDSSKHYHGLGTQLFLDVIADLDNVKEAYRGTVKAKIPGRGQNYFLLVSEKTDASGNKVNIPVFINETAKYNNVFIDTNKIATVFGNNQLRKYINERLKDGTLVRIKGRSIQSSEVSTTLVPHYRKNASSIDNSVSQNDPVVNTQSMQDVEKDSSNKRHSLVKSAQSELKALQKENEKLRQDVDDLKQELQLTHGRKLSRDALISSIQKILIDGYGVKLPAKELYPHVTNLYDMFYNNTVDGKRLKKDERVDTMRIIEEMDKIVDAVIENAVGVDDTYVEMKKLLPELRNTKIVVPMDARADAAQSAGFENWAEFRKANFGRVGFANEGLPVDTYYMELSERYPELFPDGITNPGEQAAHIADVVNTIRESGINEYQLYDIEDERIRTSIKNDVMDIIGNAEKLQTFADRAAQKVEDTKLAEAMHYGADIAKLKRLNAEKVADIKAENRKRLSDMRRKYQDRVESVRERYAEARANRSEKQKQTVLRNKVLRKYTEASTMLDRPTTENHFTEAMREPIMEFLAAVDITTGKSVAKQGIYDRILRVIEAANKATAEGDENGLGIAETDLNVQEKQLIVDSGLLERMSAWVEANKGKKLTELSSAQLEELNGIFNQLKHLTAEIKRLYDPREGLAAKSWQAQKEIGLAKNRDRKTRLLTGLDNPRKLAEWIHYGSIDAYGFFNTIDSDVMDEQLRTIRRCQDKFGANIARLSSLMTDAVGKSGIPEGWHGKKAKEITLNLSTGTLRATPSQLMTVYLLLNQEDSRRCLFNKDGGLVIGKFKARAGVQTKENRTRNWSLFRTVSVFNEQSKKLVLNEADANKIIESLTDAQIACADRICAILNGEAARLGNEVSMAMYGYKKYTTENYFPMRTVDDYRAIENNPNNEMTLLGLSFTHERTRLAGKALVAEDIFDVVGRHLTNMAQYNAFAQELDNAKKMYALRLGNGTSLKQTLIRQYGDQADKFYRNLINNLSGTEIYASQGVGAFSEKLLSNYKAAAVAKNISVVLKQPMSIFRALPEFSSAGIKAWNSFKDLSPSQVKAEMNEMLEHSGVAKLKSWGASENMTRKSFEELYNNEPKNYLVKINDAMDSGAEFADMWTWSRLWRMSKAEINAQNKYTKGSKEYFEAVNSKFSEVIGKTQVVQSALDSSMAVQNAGTASKFLYAFQNEPLKQYSYLTSAINDAVRGKPGAKKKLVKVIASSVANTVAVSAITTLVSLWRGTLDRDDDDELWDDILKSFSENALKDILSGGLAPVWQLAETVWTAIESGAFGKTVERMDLAALTDLGGLINKYLVSQNGGRPNLGMLQDIVNAASNLFGWSAKNVIRDFKAGLDRIIFDSGLVSPMTQYNYLKAWKDVELTNKAAVTEAYYDVLRDAVDRGRYSDYVKIKRDMIYHGYTETKIKNAVMKSSLMDDLYELKKVNPGSYKAKVNSIVSSVSAVSSLEGKEFEDFIESAMKRREREDGGSKTDDEVYDEMHRKMEKEVKEQLIYIDVSKRAAYIKKMLKTYGEYGITEADILKVLRKAGKA